MKKIVVVDIGISNILSIKNALEFCGADVVVTNKKKVIEKSNKIVLPGVGAFQKGILNIKKLQLKNSLIKHCNDKNKFFLGICLGMQLLFEKSFENGLFNGLGILKGSIKKLPKKNKILKLPHIGWNQVQFKNKKNLPLFKNIKNLSHFYFVHSYYACNTNNKNVIGTTRFGKFVFPSVVAKNNIFGIQFHAEKSSDNGIKMLKNFVKL
tara:strand:- start:262 stop:888 length:627 start_codon:yes stop_codon:yes gene_type:complete